ncbi:methylenetetrahydrofolate reductase C-terminal domain-containing protein [Paracoccus simplex]|uniref:Methylenetetrahydrofolate reductase C-terminal domain-containing protein n=1 Tax=Paracoccus simplex TaxID=2086346 RepID=A0ABV7S5I6_9RHOB
MGINGPGGGTGMAATPDAARIPAPGQRPSAPAAAAAPAPAARGRLWLWSVRHARGLERLYRILAALFLRLHPLWQALGYARAERPVRFVERQVKGLLFDCRMCGQCVLSATGMSCPMNCPKQLRNGPCGGVRADGHCEVAPEMPCAWVKAWEGARRMAQGDAILAVQKPVDRRLAGRSSWLDVTAREAAARRRDAA